MVKKFITEEEFKDNLEMQIQLVPVIFGHLQDQGVTRDEELPIHFYFYTNAKAKAEQLFEHLRTRSKFRMQEPHKVKGTWSVIGRIEKCKIEVEILQKIVEGLSMIGYGFDCLFDGFEVEVLIEKKRNN